MELACTIRASFGLALWASSTLASFLGVEVGRSDPDSTSRVRAVNPVAGVVLVVLFVECDFKLEVEQVFDV